MARDVEPMRHGGCGTRRSALGILGDVRLVGPDGPIAIGSAKERCVLAVLAVDAGAAVGRDRLVDALWDGAPPRSAANAVQNYVLRLRRALRAIDGLRIRTDAAGYRLEVPDDHLDSVVAERTIDRARTAAGAGDLAGASALLGGAIELWRGPALAEFAERPFARAEARRLDEMREAAREDRIDHELALGHHHTVIVGLEPMTATHPWRERRWAQLMVALYRADRQADALAAFARLRSTLRDDLGVEPGPALRTLHERVLRHDPELGIARPAVHTRGPIGTGAAAVPAGGDPDRPATVVADRSVPPAGVVADRPVPSGPDDRRRAPPAGRRTPPTMPPDRRAAPRRCSAARPSCARSWPPTRRPHVDAAGW